jgi:hypothetical protein
MRRAQAHAVADSTKTQQTANPLHGVEVIIAVQQHMAMFDTECAD